MLQKIDYSCVNSNTLKNHKLQQYSQNLQLFSRPPKSFVQAKFSKLMLPGYGGHILRHWPSMSNLTCNVSCILKENGVDTAVAGYAFLCTEAIVSFLKIIKL